MSASDIKSKQLCANVVCACSVFDSLAVLEGQDMGSFRSDSLLGSLSRHVSAVTKTSRMAALSCQIMRPISSMGSKWPLAVDGDGTLHTPPSSRPTPSPPSSPSFPVTRSDSPPFFTPGRSDDGILPTPRSISLVLLPSGARALPSGARTRLRKVLLRPSLVWHLRHLGRLHFPFLLSPLPCFLHLLLICLMSSLLYLSLLP